MKYKVIKQFKDLQDNNHIYNVGDKYPRKGRINKERAEELSSTNNKIGLPLIMEIEGDK
ncbi:hypothetical protein [Caryophanon tenue]|uniref:hypothetical protein n=1 Tax=Caryophanon tenue TaxID=33978 RepID=UPI001FE1AF01|nr:hypothetical protein [Caryophanon tenue]